MDNLAKVVLLRRPPPPGAIISTYLSRHPINTRKKTQDLTKEGFSRIMGPPILFAKGKSTSKKTKGLQRTFRRGPVGACCAEESVLEKSYHVRSLKRGTGLACLHFPGGCSY